jgi:hypothetical protein
MERPDDTHESDHGRREPVSLDAIAATLIGYKPADIDYLRMAEARGLGSYGLNTKLK